MAIPSDNLKKKVIAKISFELTVFADSLKPSPEYIKLVKLTAQKVFDRIKSDPNFSVDRTLLGGSVGKETSVLYPDFDGVVFLNKKQPPLWETVDDFKSLLSSESASFGIVAGSITSSSATVTVEFQNGTELDLLPACSFSQDEEAQYNKVMELIKACPEKYLAYSSSLADTQIRFLRVQDGPTHQLIRLVKYWFKSLTLDEDVYGGSYLMEVLCVTVCHEADAQQGSTKNFLFEAFKATLQKIAKIYTLKIAFLRKYDPKTKKPSWKLLPENQIAQNKNSFGSDILKRPRFIIDPSNPYNDLFKNMSETVVHKLKCYAELMLKRWVRLESVESDELKTVTQSPNLEVVLHIDKIFEPLSLSISGSYPGAPLPEKIVIHFDYQSHNSSDSKTETQSSLFFLNNKNAKKISKAVLTNLVFLVRARAKRFDNRYIYDKGIADVPTKNDIKQAVGTLTEQFPSGSIKESASNSDHKSCDVSLYIPYKFKDSTLAVRFSMKWK